jgi:biotin carboxylase
MQKMLIIGAGTLQLPAILKAKEMGLEVAVVDFDPSAPGVSYADHFFNISTIDEKRIVDAAIKYNPDGVMTMATDMPMRSVAAVGSVLSLPSISYEVALNSTDKARMIRCFKSSNVPHPWFKVYSEIAQFKNELNQLNPPYIIKPSDSSGSKGVVLVDNMENAIDSFLYSMSNSKSGTVLVEEFMEGDEVSVETLSLNGTTSIIAITDKLISGPPFFVEMGHSQPSHHEPETIKKIKDVAIKAINSLGIDNSAAHVEMIISSQGPRLVEVGARLGGDNITSYLVPLSTGVDMVKACIQLSLGLKPDITIKFEKGAAIRYLNSGEGIFNGVAGLGEIMGKAGFKHIEITKNIGDRIGQVKGSRDRIGYVITQSDTAESAIVKCIDIINSLKVNIISD